MIVADSFQLPGKDTVTSPCSSQQCLASDLLTAMLALDLYHSEGITGAGPVRLKKLNSTAQELNRMVGDTDDDQSSALTISYSRI